jgi:hypothetical protein
MTLHPHRVFLVTSLALAAGGCYAFVYHARQSTGTEYNEVAVDWNAPHSSVRWGTAWGVGDTWMTRLSLRGWHHALAQWPGRSKIHEPLLYSIPLAVITLGIVFQVEMTGYLRMER